MYEVGCKSLSGGGGIEDVAGGGGCRIIKVENSRMKPIKHNTAIVTNVMNEDAEEVIWLMGYVEGGGGGG